MKVVYGARCTWWDTADKAGEKASSPSNPFPVDLTKTDRVRGLPCCPHCSGVLYEADDEAKWWEMARQYERDNHSGHVEFIKWARGKCFPTFDVARQAYNDYLSTQPVLGHIHLTELPEDVYFDWRIHFSGPQKHPYGGRVLHLTGEEMETVVKQYNGMMAERSDTGESEYEGE